MHQNFLVQSIIQVIKKFYIIMSKPWLERLIIKIGLMAVESNASRADLLDFVENFEAWMRKQIIIWGMAICGGTPSGKPIGHTSWSFGKKYWSFPQVLQFAKGEFLNKSYQELLASFIEVGHFRCFNASIIVQDRFREYELKGSFWVMVQLEDQRVLSLD
jgi:hypothetical protein